MSVRVAYRELEGVNLVHDLPRVASKIESWETSRYSTPVRHAHPACSCKHVDAHINQASKLACN